MGQVMRTLQSPSIARRRAISCQTAQTSVVAAATLMPPILDRQPPSPYDDNADRGQPPKCDRAEDIEHICLPMSKAALPILGALWFGLSHPRGVPACGWCRPPAAPQIARVPRQRHSCQRHLAVGTANFQTRGLALLPGSYRRICVFQVPSYRHDPARTSGL